MPANPEEGSLQDIAYRRPYEVVLLCRPASSALQAAAPPAHTAADHSPSSLEQEQGRSETCPPGPDSSAATSREAGAAGRAALSNEPHDLVIAAVPGQHSRKPHLGRLLAQHLPPRPHCLEVELRTLQIPCLTRSTHVFAMQQPHLPCHAFAFATHSDTGSLSRPERVHR